MTPRLNALEVHLLTASGAVLAMFAMLAAVKEEWSLMFLWLVVALIVLFVIVWGAIVAPFDWDLGGVTRRPVAVDAIPAS